MIDNEHDRPSIILVQRAVVLHQGRFLLLQRTAGTSWIADKWELPGGKLARGEELVASLKREVLEETGLVVNHASHMTHAQCSWADGSATREVPYITLVTLTDLVQGEVVLSDEHKASVWVTIAEAHEYDLTPTTTQALAVLSESIEESASMVQ